MWNTKWCHIYVLSAHGPRIFVPYFPNFCLHPWESVSSGSWLQISSQQAEVPTWHHGFDPMKPRLLAVVLKHLCKLINQSWPSEVLVRECSLWTWPGLRERSHMGLGVWVRSIILALAAILHVRCLLCYLPNITLILALFSIPPTSHQTTVTIFLPVSCF